MDDPVLSESAEEALAQLWQAGEEVDRREPAFCPPAGEPDDAHVIAELVDAGLIEQRDGLVSLTDHGKAEAASVVRRERLAERLLTDVLELDEQEVAETACKFEHLLHKGIDDEICTLLGHPKVCPHGSPIPPGDCCRARARAPGKVISALADLSPGQSGVVAYIHGRRRELMQRMLAMGVIPGTPITLVQTTPSYVFQLGGSGAPVERDSGGLAGSDGFAAAGQAQVAVDRETAQDIYLRITERKRAKARGTGWLPGPVRRLRFRRGRGRR